MPARGLTARHHHDPKRPRDAGSSFFVVPWLRPRSSIWLEHRSRKAGVVGSSPTVGLCGRLPLVTKTKVCNQCGRRKPIEDFYRRKEGGERRYGHCKTCQNERARKSQAKNRAKANERARRGRIKAKFGISLEAHDLLITQPCAICDESEDKRVLDHCHTTGKIRGVLCQRCNLMLGQAKDDPERLRAGIAYLVE